MSLLILFCEVSPFVFRGILITRIAGYWIQNDCWISRNGFWLFCLPQFTFIGFYVSWTFSFNKKRNFSNFEIAHDSYILEQAAAMDYIPYRQLQHVLSSGEWNVLNYLILCVLHVYSRSCRKRSFKLKHCFITWYLNRLLVCLMDVVLFQSLFDMRYCVFSLLCCSLAFKKSIRYKTENDNDKGPFWHAVISTSNSAFSAVYKCYDFQRFNSVDYFCLQHQPYLYQVEAFKVQFFCCRQSKYFFTFIWQRKFCTTSGLSYS